VCVLAFIYLYFLLCFPSIKCRLGERKRLSKTLKENVTYS